MISSSPTISANLLIWVEAELVCEKSTGFFLFIKVIKELYYVKEFIISSLIPIQKDKNQAKNVRYSCFSVEFIHFLSSIQFGCYSQIRLNFL